MSEYIEEILSNESAANNNSKDLRQTDALESPIFAEEVSALIADYDFTQKNATELATGRRSEFLKELDTLTELTALELEGTDITLDTIKTLREEAIEKALKDGEYPPNTYYKNKLREKLVTSDPRLATLEEIGISPENVKELKAAIWDIQLPLLEGKNTNGNEWAPSAPAKTIYKYRVKTILTTQSIPLHPGLIEVLLNEVYLRRREIGDAIAETLRGFSSKYKKPSRDAASKTVKDNGFILKEGPGFDPALEDYLNQNAKRRRKAKYNTKGRR